MNIYLIVEDGDSFCIQANTMATAINIRQRSYLNDRAKEEGEKFESAGEKRYYHEQILQSCSLIGELKN